MARPLHRKKPSDGLWILRRSGLRSCFHVRRSCALPLTQLYKPDEAPMTPWGVAAIEVGIEPGRVAPSRAYPIWRPSGPDTRDSSCLLHPRVAEPEGRAQGNRACRRSVPTEADDPGIGVTPEMIFNNPKGKRYKVRHGAKTQARTDSGPPAEPTANARTEAVHRARVRFSPASGLGEETAPPGRARLAEGTDRRHLTSNKPIQAERPLAQKSRRESLWQASR